MYVALPRARRTGTATAAHERRHAHDSPRVGMALQLL